MIFASMNFALHFDSSVFIRVHLCDKFPTVSAKLREAVRRDRTFAKEYRAM